MRKFLLAGLILMGIGALWSCQPKPNAADLLKNLAVYTDQFDKATDYTKFSTYYLRLDTMNYYSQGYDTLQTTTKNSGDFIDYVTQTINDTLQARGYLPVGRKASPDLKVKIYVIENYNVSYSYYPYSYGYGYGYYGYGGGYTSVNVTDQANFYVQITDPNQLVNGKPKLVWYCNIGDIASTSIDPFAKALVQAFKQSSYLRK